MALPNPSSMVWFPLPPCLDLGKSPNHSWVLPTPPSGSDWLNVEDKFHIFSEVTISGTLTFNFNPGLNSVNVIFDLVVVSMSQYLALSSGLSLLTHFVSPIQLLCLADKGSGPTQSQTPPTPPIGPWGHYLVTHTVDRSTKVKHFRHT